MSSKTIAINIALLPDETMLTRARAFNARLLRDYPDGFALDEQHAVHITLLQAFVDRRDLDAIWRNVCSIDVGHTLRAEAFDFYPNGELGTSGFDVSLPAWLRKAHQQVMAVVAPLARTEGDASAFVASEDEPTIADKSVKYVREFLSEHGGYHYNPHVTLGIAHTDFLVALREEVFEPFDFGIDALAICQLGNHGTCRRSLFRKQA